MRHQLALLGLVVVLSACGGRADRDAATVPETPVASGPVDGPSAPTTAEPAGYDPRVVAAVPVPSMPRGLAVHDGLVWVAAARTGEVVAIDPATDSVVARIAVGRLPVTLVSTTTDLWVTVLDGDASGASTELVRIDTERREATDRVGVPAFHAVPVGAGAAWAMGDDGVLRRFDPSAGEVTDEIAVDPGTNWIGADDAAVWGVRSDGSAWRLDPASLEVTHEVELGFAVPGRSRVVVGHGRFWVSVPGRLVALDAATGDPLLDIERPTDHLINDLDLDDRSVWLSVVVRAPERGGPAGRLVRFDADTGAVVDEFALGPVPSELDVMANTVWIGDQQEQVVLRLSLP